MVKYKGQIYPTITEAADQFIQEKNINCRVNKSTFTLDDGQVVVVALIGTKRIIYVKEGSNTDGCFINIGSCKQVTCGQVTSNHNIFDD